MSVGNTCTGNLQIICWSFEYHPSKLIVWYEICGVKFINFMIPMGNTVFKHKWLIKHLCYDNKTATHTEKVVQTMILYLVVAVVIEEVTYIHPPFW